MRAAIVVACVLCTSTASAQGIGREWLEKMSGPEPAGIEVRFPMACLWQKARKDAEGKREREVTWYWDTPETKTLRSAKVDVLKDGKPILKDGKPIKELEWERQLCLDFGFASLSNRDREEEGFHVTAQRLEAGFTWRLDQYHDWVRAVEPGIVVGAIGFLTDTNREWRLDVSGRISVRLLDLIPKVRQHRFASLIRVTFRPEVIVGGISNDDLGADPAEPFDHRFRWGGSFRRAPWITVDFSELVSLR